MRFSAAAQRSGAALALALLSACAAAPAPAPLAQMPIPTHFKEAGALWLPAASEHALDRSAWWELFADPGLNRLAQRLQISNQNIAAAVAAYAQAQALLREHQAGLLPGAGLSISAPLAKSATDGKTQSGTGAGNSAQAKIDWAPDLWGRLQAAVDQAQASAQASQADLAAARLSALGALASAYFQLRAADAEIALLAAQTASEQRNLQIVHNRYSAGLAAQTDVFQAQTQLLNLQAELSALRQNRARLEHALAVLTGQAPADFDLPAIAAGTAGEAGVMGVMGVMGATDTAGGTDAAAVMGSADTVGATNAASVMCSANASGRTDTAPVMAAADTAGSTDAAAVMAWANAAGGTDAAPVTGSPDTMGSTDASAAAPFAPPPPLPEIPPGLPSTLLQRRPDIAAAERALAAANAQIGVQRAAYFPALTLQAAVGGSSASLARLFSAPALAWSLGATLAQTLFDGGAAAARQQQAVAARDARAAAYRQTVLGAFQGVEDQLGALHRLAQQQPLRAAAAEASARGAQQMRNRYHAGRVDYTQVVSADASALAARRALLQLQLNRQLAVLGLIQALGGGWQAPWQQR